MGFIHLPELGDVHFHEYGSGSKPLLAFHGYGMTGKQFKVLEKSVLTKYHVYGFDHFFHGESEIGNITEQQIITGMPGNMVRNYVEEWFKIYGRQRFSVMAYSIGAKLALLLVEEFPDLIEDVILMAPDGMPGYKGFEFLTNKPVGRFLFRIVTKSKWLAPALIKTIWRLGVIDDSLYKIAYSEIDTPQKRQDVYYTLNLIRLLKPDMEKIVKLVNEHQIRCKFIFGLHDALFPKSAAMPIINLLTKAEVYEVPMGHWLVTKQLDKYLITRNA